MKKGKILLSAIGILLISSTGCQKYPEGPLLSIHSKTERVANDWKVAQALDNGNDVTTDYNEYELNLSKSGGATLSAKYVVLGSTLEFVTDGKWAFVNNKEKLSFDFENNAGDGIYRILKLKEDEMWLKQDDGSVELHFVSK